MTPEENIERTVAAVIEWCGHWPYTREERIYAGWRPAGDTYNSAGDRATRVSVQYDIVLCHQRGSEFEAERARFALQRNLAANGWAIKDCGPEAYHAQTEMFYWPITVEKGFGIGEDGRVYDLKEERERRTT